MAEQLQLPDAAWLDSELSGSIGPMLAVTVAQGLALGRCLGDATTAEAPPGNLPR